MAVPADLWKGHSHLPVPPHTGSPKAHAPADPLVLGLGGSGEGSLRFQVKISIMVRRDLWAHSSLPESFAVGPLCCSRCILGAQVWLFPAPFHPPGSLGGRPGSPDPACLGRWGWNYLIRQIGSKVKALSWFPAGQVPSGRSPVDPNLPTPQPPPRPCYTSHPRRGTQSSQPRRPPAAVPVSRRERWM